MNTSEIIAIPCIFLYNPFKSTCNVFKMKYNIYAIIQEVEMKNTELAKMFNVSESTIWRWRKVGILEQKISEYKQLLEIEGKKSEAESHKTLLKILEEAERIEKALEMLPNIALILQDIESELKKPISSKVEASYKSVNENIGDALEHFTTTQLANALRLDKTTIQRWIKKGKVKGTKMGAQYVIPKEEALAIVFKKVYDDVNLKIKTNANDSVSIKDFKDELKKVIQLNEEEVNKTLLDLNEKEILCLQTADNPGPLTEEERRAAIEFNGRTLFFITC